MCHVFIRFIARSRWIRTLAILMVSKHWFSVNWSEAENLLGGMHRLPPLRAIRSWISKPLSARYWSPASISWQNCFSPQFLCYWFFLDIADWQMLSNHWVRCKPGLWMCHEIYNLNTFLNASDSPLAVHILAPCNLKLPAHFQYFPLNESGKYSFIFSFDGHAGKLPSNI